MQWPENSVCSAFGSGAVSTPPHRVPHPRCRIRQTRLTAQAWLPQQPFRWTPGADAFPGLPLNPGHIFKTPILRPALCRVVRDDGKPDSGAKAWTVGGESEGAGGWGGEGGGGRWGAARGQHGTRSRTFCSHSSPANPQCLGLRGCFPASFLMGGPPGLTDHSVLRILAFPSSHRRNFGLQPERNGETSNGSLQGERGSDLGRESRCRLGMENGPEEA